MEENTGGKRIPYGIPTDVVLLATPGGWRRSTTTADGSLFCGRPADLPAAATAEQAKEKTAAMLRELGLEFHGTTLDVSWEPGRTPGSWYGRVLPGPAPVPG